MPGHAARGGIPSHGADGAVLSGSGDTCPRLAADTARQVDERDGGRRSAAIFARRAAQALRRASYRVADQPPASPLSLAVVFVAWDEQRSVECLRALLSLDLGAGVRATVVTVANRPLPGLDAFPVTAIAGSNVLSEFSGYDEGLAHVRRLGEPFDAYLFANDRFLSYDDDYLGDLTHGALATLVAARTAAGRLDLLPAPRHLLGAPFGSYLRSNWVLLPARALEDLGTITSLDGGALDEHLPVAFTPDVFDRMTLEYDYRHFLRGWLTTSTDTGQKWYAATGLDEQSWPLLRRKIGCVLNEHLLSVRLRDSGFALMTTFEARSCGVLGARSLPARATVRHRRRLAAAENSGRSSGEFLAVVLPECVQAVAVLAAGAVRTRRREGSRSAR